MRDIDKVRQLEPLLSEAQTKILEIFKLVNEMNNFEINGGNGNDLSDFTKVKELMVSVHVSAKAMNNTFRDNGKVKF